MKLGVFGGTFDPPHVAHLILASEAHHQLALDKVLWVLTPLPPHKRNQPITTLTHRFEMLEIAVKENPVFELSKVDLNRPPPYYAVDAMHILRRLHPEAELTYLMGGDSLSDLPNWKKPLEFISVCDWLGVLPRLGESSDLLELDRSLPGVKEKVRFIKAPVIDISASDIRQRIQKGKPYQYYLLPGVYQYITKNNLYR